MAAIAVGLVLLVIRYSDDLSPYSLTVLFTVAFIGFLFWVLIIDQWRAWIGFCLISIGAFFFHYFVAVFVLGQIVAVFWIGWISNRDVFWVDCFRKAVGWFAVVGILLLLWALQVFRGFEVSMYDNMVTGTVYAVAEGFWLYLTDHLCVLMGLFVSFSWTTWFCMLVLVLVYRHTLCIHPLLARILLILLLMVVVLIALIYILQSVAYGGRTYYGFRWFCGYVFAIIIPMVLVSVYWIQGQSKYRFIWVTVGLLSGFILCFGCVIGT